jgi:hypothetical protein
MVYPRNEINASPSPFFARQLDFYGVGFDKLAQPAVQPDAGQRNLVCCWHPERSDVKPLRVDRNHIAVFALRELVLGPGQQLIVQGPHQERVLLLVETLHMAPDARIVLTMRTDLVVDRFLSRIDGESVSAARVLLTSAPGAKGVDGAPGEQGGDGSHPDSQGGSGGYGGPGNEAGRGQASGEALISVGYLQGDVLFEVGAGRGGDGGGGGRGGNGGKGGFDEVSKKMAGGGRGGSGGAGGHGGGGGNGGRMRVWIQQVDRDARYRAVATAAAGGAGGCGGGAGIPGLGQPDGVVGMSGMHGCSGATGMPGQVEIGIG